jgi:hypothetical protein
MKRIILSLALALVSGACSDATAPQSGIWSATTGVGFSFELTVSSGGNEITEIEYFWSGLSCGGVIHLGGTTAIERTPGWPISDRTFAILPTDLPHINGTFNETGTEASGSWAWSGCGEGTWTAAP